MALLPSSTGGPLLPLRSPLSGPFLLGLCPLPRLGPASGPTRLLVAALSLLGGLLRPSLRSPLSVRGLASPLSRRGTALSLDGPTPAPTLLGSGVRLATPWLLAAALVAPLRRLLARLLTATCSVAAALSGPPTLELGAPLVASASLALHPLVVLRASLPLQPPSRRLLVGLPARIPVPVGGARLGGLPSRLSLLAARPAGLRIDHAGVPLPVARWPLLPRRGGRLLAGLPAGLVVRGLPALPAGRLRIVRSLLLQLARCVVVLVAGHGVSVGRISRHFRPTGGRFVPREDKDWSSLTHDTRPSPGALRPLAGTVPGDRSWPAISGHR